MEDIRERFLKIAIELDERKPFPEDAFNFFFRNPKGYNENNDYLNDKFDEFDDYDYDYDYDSSSSCDIYNDDIIYDSCSNNNQNESESENED